MLMRRRDWLAGVLATGVGAAWGCNSAVQADDGALEATWGVQGLAPGKLQKPRAIAIDAHDQLYICDITARIQVFSRDGKYLRGWRTPESVNGRPTGMSIIDNTLYVADTHYFRVLAYDLQGQPVPERSWGTAGNGPGQLGWVTDVAADREGNRYVSEYGELDRIQKFGPNGSFLLEFGASGNQPGQFLRPQCLAVSATGELWVCDAGNHRLQVFDGQGKWLRSIGQPGSGPGEFSYPYAMLFDSAGNLLVCEYGNHRVQKTTPAGTSLGFFGGPGKGPGQMHNPWSLVADSRGSLHVLDSWNHRVHRFRL